MRRYCARVTSCMCAGLLLAWSLGRLITTRIPWALGCSVALPAWPDPFCCSSGKVIADEEALETPGLGCCFAVLWPPHPATSARTASENPARETRHARLAARAPARTPPAAGDDRLTGTSWTS